MRNAGEELDRRLAESSSQAKLGRELADLFRLLAHADRLRLIEELRAGEKDVTSLAHALDLPATRISQHLAQLRARDQLIKSRTLLINHVRGAVKSVGQRLPSSSAEAFAAQALAVIRDSELDPAKINPLGGAIALGHPLGATGAIRSATVVHALRRHHKKYGMVTMCVGMGQGAAGIFERV